MERAQRSSPSPRSEIFQDFVELGMRECWKWHRIAETYEVTLEERKVLECRPWSIRSIASRIGSDLRQAMVTDSAHPMGEEDSRFRTDLKGFEMMVCEYDGQDPFDVLPELVYSMTAFDDPDDVEEVRRERPGDQSLWVTGVVWIRDRILWVDEFGSTIRKGRFGEGELKDAAEAFEAYKPFESVSRTGARRVGKYAEDGWRL